MRSGQPSTRPERTLDQVYREDWGRLLARLVARTRRLDLAEDSLGEAFARAADRWQRDGVPDNPAGWLYTTAYRVAIGRMRAEATAGRKAPLLAVRSDWTITEDPAGDLGDDRLHLILLCCHPALPEASRSALALRLVIGTPTEQIAQLFLVKAPTMAARLTRAKKKIVQAGIPLGAPIGDELRSRLNEVCRTIYLAFTAGYTPRSGPDLLRADLAGDAVRLSAILHSLVPKEPTPKALLAVLSLQHSRRDARSASGKLIRLADQDRSLWRGDEIETALTLLAELDAGQGYYEELRLQGLIAAEHARVRDGGSTNWASIANNYALLEALTGSSVVRLNRAVAVAEAHGPDAGLALLEGLESALPRNHRVSAVRAELATRAGHTDDAASALERALRLCTNDAEHAHLTRRLAALTTQVD